MNKKIWSYWESSGNASDDSLVEICQASWKEHCTLDHRFLQYTT